MKKKKISDFVTSSLKIRDIESLILKQRVIKDQLHLVRYTLGAKPKKDEQKYFVKKLKTKILILDKFTSGKKIRDLRYITHFRVINDLIYYPVFKYLKGVTNLSFVEFDFREISIILKHFKFQSIKRIRISNFKMSDLDELRKVFSSITFMRNLRFVLIQEPQNYLIKTSSLNFKKVERIIPRIERMKKLEKIELNSRALSSMLNRYHFDYGRIISLIPKLEAKETFLSLSEDEITEFFKGFSKHCKMNALNLTWSNYTKEFTPEAFTGLTGLKTLFCSFKDGIPPKLIQNVQKIEGLEKLDWRVDTQNFFYFRIDQVIASCKGTLQRITKIVKLKTLYLDVMETGPDLFAIFGGGLTQLRYLTELYLNFPLQTPNLKWLFNSLRSKTLINFGFEGEVLDMMDANAFGDCIASMAEKLETLKLKFINRITEDLLTPIYEGIRRLSNISYLRIFIEEFYFKPKAKRSISRISKICKGFSKIRRLYLNLSKSFDDEDLFEFLTWLSNYQGNISVFLESSMGTIKKSYLSKIEDELRNAKEKIFQLNLPSAGYPNLSSWANV